MKYAYTTAAAALALGVSEAAIIKTTGATKGTLNLAQLLTVADDDKLKKYEAEAQEIRQLLDKVNAAEEAVRIPGLAPAPKAPAAPPKKQPDKQTGEEAAT